MVTQYTSGKLNDLFIICFSIKTNSFKWQKTNKKHVILSRY
jgi:hypothetical protein